MKEQTLQWSKRNKGQKDKQRSTKHYTENLRLSNKNPTKNSESTHLLHRKRSSTIKVLSLFDGDTKVEHAHETNV